MDKKYIVSRDILIYAFRYALGRQSFAPLEVQNTIRENINSLSDGDIKLYIREIKQCDYYGMECDKVSWLNFMNYLENILNDRYN